MRMTAFKKNRIPCDPDRFRVQSTEGASYCVQQDPLGFFDNHQRQIFIAKRGYPFPHILGHGGIAFALSR